MIPDLIEIKLYYPKESGMPAEPKTLSDTTKPYSVSTYVLPIINYCGNCLKAAREYIPYKWFHPDNSAETVELTAQLVSQTETTRKQNKKSASLYKKLHSFIDSDNELKICFNKAFNETQHLLINLPIMDNSLQLDDPVLEAWRSEMQTANYWLAVTESLRDFLQKNSDFSQLLCSKFNMSCIQNKEEILKHYGLQ